MIQQNQKQTAISINKEKMSPDFATTEPSRHDSLHLHYQVGSILSVPCLRCLSLQLVFAACLSHLSSLPVVAVYLRLTPNFILHLT